MRNGSCQVLKQRFLTVNVPLKYSKKKPKNSNTKIKKKETKPLIRDDLESSSDDEDNSE